MKRFLSLMMALTMLTSLAMADEATPTDVAEAPSAPETMPETVEELAETKQPAEPVTTETPAEPETAAKTKRERISEKPAERTTAAPSTTAHSLTPLMIAESRWNLCAVQV